LEIAAEPDATEAIEFAFNSLASLGTEISYFRNANNDLVSVIGYFNETPDDEALRDELHYALRIYGLGEEAVRSVEHREVEQTDWLREWKKHWRPTAIGRLLIAPPWEAVDESDRIVIRIEPNMAFGTGTHHTTQLCLKAIETNYAPGESFLDVGTGTGILAIAAAKLDAEETEQRILARRTSSGPPIGSSMAQIAACDTDSDSIRIARENAELNGIGGRIEFIDGPLPEDAPAFDFVCANLTLDVIVTILPLLLAKTRKTLVLSGVLEEQRDAMERSLVDSGASRYHIEQSGEWIAITVAAGETGIRKTVGS
jgi:ribosomal protein L11 methyltransferase